MKTLLLLVLTFSCLNSNLFSQKKVELDEKGYEDAIYSNRINNKAKFHNIESHFNFDLKGDTSNYYKLVLLLKENENILESFYDDKSKLFIVITNKTQENESFPSIKDSIYSMGFRINNFTETFYKK